MKIKLFFVLTFVSLTIQSCIIGGAMIMGISYSKNDIRRNKEEKISNKQGNLYLLTTLGEDSILTLFKSKKIINPNSIIYDQNNILKNSSRYYFKFKSYIIGFNLNDSSLIINNFFIPETKYKGDTLNRRYYKLYFIKNKDSILYYANRIDYCYLIQKGSIGYYNGIKPQNVWKLKKKIYNRMKRKIDL